MRECKHPSLVFEPTNSVARYGRSLGKHVSASVYSCIRYRCKTDRLLARLVTLTSPRGHITPVMEALHWLPVSHRIIFKTPLLVYKALNGLAPGYLSDLLNLKNRNSKLRQLHDHLTLSVPQATLTIAKGAFGVTAPVYWNLLPLSLRQASSLRAFKSGLKTHFFRSLYDNECQF